jgi:formylglycine-generating enzyme required for sulfatase activity
VLGIFISMFLLTLFLSPSPGETPRGMVLVKGGTFMMGTNERVSDEEPVHRVTVNNFYIGKFEVTQEEWEAVMGNNPSLYKGDNLAVETVTWNDAVEYCNKRSRKEGLNPCYTIKNHDITFDIDADGYRLPTEAEWEYASRGGVKSRNYRYSGSNNPEEVAWYEVNAGGTSHPPGQLKPNELGIYDMSGNIWEWCWDWYDSDYYKTSPPDNPWGPGTGKKRIYRGGGAGGIFVWARCTGRYSFPPTLKHWFVGLRVARNHTGKNHPPDSMIFVKGGTFEMGSNEGIVGQKLVHPVTVSSFYMGKFEVTQEEWRAVMKNNPSNVRGAKKPIHSVDWYDVVEYCNQRSRKEGLTPCYTGSGDQITCDFEADGYRLPTEAEWEYAGKGGDRSRNYKYSGSNNAQEVAWYINNSGLKPQPVGQKKSNELGIYDMSGNVGEWCWDWYEFDYYKNSPGKNPKGPLSGMHRVIRSGSWAHPENNVSSTFRLVYTPHRRSSFIGIRVVRTVNVAEIPQIADTGESPAKHPAYSNQE